MSTIKTVITSIILLATILGGFCILFAYESTSGPASALSQSWPRSSSITLADSEPYTLVLFVHPQCPCSNASISELAVLMTACPKITTYVLFLRPPGFAPGWEKSALWQRTTAIPGVTAVADIDGREGANFCATTSGECGLYDRRGKQVFRGGITSTRGHEGDSQGLSTIKAIVGGAPRGAVQTAVFGCCLKDDALPINGAKQQCLR